MGVKKLEQFLVFKLNSSSFTFTGYPYYKQSVKIPTSNYYFFSYWLSNIH